MRSCDDSIKQQPSGKVVNREKEARVVDSWPMRQLGERTNHGSSSENEQEAGIYCSGGSVDGFSSSSPPAALRCH